jgi:hypothetical protein
MKRTAGADFDVDPFNSIEVDDTMLDALLEDETF